MEKKRLLPIGIQDFEDLRKKGFIYADKTALVYKLATEGKPYFLSRPRRFGKSLLISTMKAYFLGKKELFEGLAIEQMEQHWIEYPVININFANDEFSEIDSLDSKLNDILNEYEYKYGIEEKSARFAGRLEAIIKKANSVTGRQVVILIDEYDKPILDALYTELEDKNRKTLRGFYSPLKGCDEYIRFLFMTGITKVSHVNIFSGLNQLNDISLDENYSSICGITENELEAYFKPEIEVLAQKKQLSYEAAKLKLAQMYDGYHFTYGVEGVYNPFSLLNCFDKCRFNYYWFETATPSYLVKTLQNQSMELSSLINGAKAEEWELKNYNPDSNNMLPVMYQSGYLTIKEYDEEDELYTLDFPNKEVENGFIKMLLINSRRTPNNLKLEISGLKSAIRNKDINGILEIIKAAIADLPTITKKDMCENYYESVTHLMFRMTGFDVVSELQSFCGRSDVILTTDDTVFIIELKMGSEKSFEEVAQQGLRQIDENGYSDRFAVSGKTIIKACVVFSNEAKGLIGWKVNPDIEKAFLQDTNLI